MKDSGLKASSLETFYFSQHMYPVQRIANVKLSILFSTATLTSSFPSVKSVCFLSLKKSSTIEN